MVVDNGSTDGSVEWLIRAWPQLDVLPLARNVGFAAANNRAIERTAGPWLALLNNDAQPEPGWLESLVEAGQSAPRVGSVASLMVFQERPAVVNSAGISVDPTGIAWDRLGGAPASAAGTAAEVFGASAGAGLFARAALDDASEPGAGGGWTAFDERFFMFMEDVDLAWRLRLRGWRGLYAPGARVLHAGSATAGEGSAFKNRLLARNKVWAVVKNYPSPALIARLPLIAAYDLGSAPYRLVVQGQSAAFRGRIDALRGLRPMLQARRRIQARRLASWSDIAAALAPLEPPWAIPRRYAHLGAAAERGAAPS
jgi:GT2 family glycosyltransferase